MLILPQASPQILPQKLESDHYIIYFGLRNPTRGPGLGSDGVRDRVFVLTYLEALERLFDVMTSTPWGRPAPVVGLEKKTKVYIYNTEPYTAFDRNRIPYIVLPSRSNETTTHAELHRAAAEAVHEATHVFNFTKRPLYDPYTKAWEWFDEGLAVFMETQVVSGNPDYFRFLMNWIDKPETPLDDLAAKYQAGMFIRYLSKRQRLGIPFINTVWTNSEHRETPFDTMKRFMPSDLTLISPDPNVKDLFASGYCMDPYFMRDHESASLAPDVLVRYGERAISESLVLRDRERQSTTKGELDHLACRYYRIYLKNGLTKLRVNLILDAAGDQTPLKAEIAVATVERRRSRVTPLFPQPPSPDGVRRWAAELDTLDPDEVDHVVLVISNCGTKPYTDDETVDHDDGTIYTIEAIGFE